MKSKQSGKVNYKTVTNEVIKNYRSWLAYSNFTEDKLLNYRTTKQFHINKYVHEDGRLSFSLLSGNEVIGRPITSPSTKQNEYFMVDLSFLLLYIAQRLDEANFNSKHKEYSENYREYFYNTVREFLLRENP